VFPDVNSPSSVIRNEELLLLRAEARMLGMPQDLAGATADLNRVRAAASSPPIDPLAGDRNALLTRLLYERRYSLFFEGFRWVDLKRFGRLGDIRAERPADRVMQGGWPYPANEVPQ